MNMYIYTYTYILYMYHAYVRTLDPYIILQYICQESGTFVSDAGVEVEGDPPQSWQGGVVWVLPPEAVSPHCTLTI